MRVLVIEDEPLVARDLQNMVRRLEPSWELMGPLGTLESARAWLDGNPAPDLLLMDIQLADGVSFDLFRTHTPPCPIVFTTAYNEYAIRAFKLNSVDYLLKPVDEAELAAAFAKFKTWQQTPEPRPQPIEDLRQYLQTAAQQTGPRYKERFLVPWKNALIPLATNEIALFQKEEIIFLYTHDGRRFIPDVKTMEELESLLDPSQWFRANRQTLFALSAIEQVRSGLNGRIVVRLKSPGNQEIEVSRERAPAFRTWVE